MGNDLLKEKTKKRLAELGKFGDTYDSIVTRLIDAYIGKVRKKRKYVRRKKYRKKPGPKPKIKEEDRPLGFPSGDKPLRSARTPIFGNGE